MKEDFVVASLTMEIQLNVLENKMLVGFGLHVSKIVIIFEIFEIHIFSELGLGDDETVYRSCIKSSDIGEECVDGDLGPVGATVCFCTDDDCNKDKDCTCNSSSTIGISVVALLVCAYALFEVK